MEKALSSFDNFDNLNIESKKLDIVGLTEDYRGGFEGFTVHNPIFSDPTNESDFVYAKLGPKWPYNLKKDLKAGIDAYKDLDDSVLGNLDKYSQNEITNQGGIFFDKSDLSLLSRLNNLKPNNLIATYSNDFVKSLKNIGFNDVNFDLELKGFKLTVTDQETFEKLCIEYGEKAKQILKNEISNSDFGQTTDLMTDSARVLLEDSGLVDSEKWVLYNLYALHTRDFNVAVKYLSGNRIFQQKDINEVIDLLKLRYKEIKSGEEDFVEFDNYLNIIKDEVLKRDKMIEEKLNKIMN